MNETIVVTNRIRVDLRKEVIVAHGNDSLGSHEPGPTPATDDKEIIFRPHGQYFILTVLVGDTMENKSTN
jgi:hypothetical protein